MLAVGGCANEAAPVTPYDEVAQIVGAQLATAGEGGELTALADATMIMQGAYPGKGNVTVMHDGIAYQYQVGCVDKPTRYPATSCSGPMATAQVSALWGGPVYMPRFEAATSQLARWKIGGINGGELSWVTGSSLSWFDTTFMPGTSDAKSILVQTTKDVTFIWDPSAMKMRAGSESASIIAVEDQTSSELTGTVVFDRADRATLTLDDRIYWINPANGDTTIATQLE
jgi:hypothetical protein